MPELPEVETMRRMLSARVKGRRIKRVEIAVKKMVQGMSAGELNRLLRGKYIVEVRRRGKYLLFGLAGRRQGRAKAWLVWHMRMTGHLLFRNPQAEEQQPRLKRPFADPRNQFIRARVYFTDGTYLAFSDVRKFGTLHLVQVADWKQIPEVLSLGPEPLQLSWTAWRALWKNQQGKLKAVLQNQQFLAGIGNIYADEILWHARLHPAFAAAKLSPTQLRRLWLATRAVLKQAISTGGTSVADFRNVAGRPGRYGEKRAVYRRAGEICRRCGTKIRRIVFQQRGTYFCPRCQQR
jgi:formamidopyrimidine-DNA glycosylase